MLVFFCFISARLSSKMMDSDGMGSSDIVGVPSWEVPATAPPLELIFFCLFLLHFSHANFKDDGFCWDGQDIGAGLPFLLFLLHFSQANFKDDGFCWNG